MAESTSPAPRQRRGLPQRTTRRADRWRGAVAWTDPDGKPRRRAFSGKRQADVRRRMDELRAELDAGREPASPRTLADYLTGWLEAERARVRPVDMALPRRPRPALHRPCHREPSSSPT